MSRGDAGPAADESRGRWRSPRARQVLLVNPPLVDGVAFTRQGRCQEREDVLGTTKPPYSLVVMASLLRERKVPFRLVDLTAERRDSAWLGGRLAAERFTPDVVVFPSTTPTLRADVAAMAELKARFGALLVSFGPHASASPLEAMARAPEVDVMIVGEPEDVTLAILDHEPLDDLSGLAAVTWRRPDGTIEPPVGHGVFSGFVTQPFPAWDLLSLSRYRVPLAGEPYVIIETSRGCPYTCDFCVAPLHQGHRFRQRDPESLVAEIERARRELGVRAFYLWADTVTLDRRALETFCDALIARNLGILWFGNARADNLTDLTFVRRLRESGCWMLGMGVESASAEIRDDMVKRLDDRAIRTAFANLRDAGIRSFAFFILGYPGDTPDSMARTADYAIELSPDFANFYPAVPYPGTALYEKVRRERLLPDEDWSRMEYSFYLLEGHGLNDRLVMQAIHRARRRFFLRPSYVARHLADLARLAWDEPAIALRLASQVLLGRRPEAPRQPGGPALRTST
jgi:anaerobic magnesium-protoporphyrin IX monomethyl ester cyclase